MRQKIYFFIILAVVSANLGLSTVQAQDGTTVFFSPSNIEVNAGGGFSLTLSVNTGEIISDMGFTLNYDPNLIFYVGGTEEYYSQGCLFQLAEEMAPGNLSVGTFMCANVYDESGKIIKLNFQALNQAGSADFTFSDTLLSLFMEPIMADWQPASVTILSGVIPDIEAPAITISEPAGGGVYNYISANNLLGISGMATDNIGITNFSYAINGAATAEEFSASSSIAWRFDALLQEGENTITVSAADAADNNAYSIFVINYQLPDTEAPVIFNIATSTLTEKAIISWETSEPATSQVEYGEDESCGQQSDLISATTTVHRVELNNLNPGSSYYFKIKSRDTEANEVVSNNLKFSTFPLSRLYFSPANAIAGSDKDFYLPLNIDTSIAIRGIGGVINYDPNLISFVQLDEGNFLSQKCSTSLISSPVSAGALLFSLQCLNNTDGIAGMGEALVFNFKTAAIGQTATTTVYFSAVDSEIIVPMGESFTSITALWGDAAVTIDTQPPVISLKGAPSVNINVGGTYNDPGAVAIDNVDGNISEKIIVSNSVNANQAGSYSITYNAADSAGNTAQPVRRTITVSGLPQNNPPAGGGEAPQNLQTGQNNSSDQSDKDNGQADSDQTGEYQAQEETVVKPESEDVIVLGVEYEDYSALSDLTGLKKEIAESISQNEAHAVYDHDQTVEMNGEGKEIFNNFLKAYANNFTESEKSSLAYFIKYGTFTTQKFKAVDRADILKSYGRIFKKLPRTEAEWQDVIKISNGRWPNERNKAAEIFAYDNFRKIFLREPDRKNTNDDAAIMIMAYGIRPAPRNLSSEKKAAGFFRVIYGHAPVNASDWDAVRTIAYSGATRR